MSIRLMSAAWDLDIPSTEKMVLMCLCDFANDEGSQCWPSVATIARKCSKGERTVQAAIRSLVDMGFLAVNERAGTSSQYVINPRKICTPANPAPPQKTAKTPAKSAPNPPRTTNNKIAHALPANWHPEPFTSGGKCQSIVAAWSADDLETQVEHFIAHHSARNNKFVNWQDAWKTWVLNSAKWPVRPAAGPRYGETSPDDFMAHMARKTQGVPSG